MEESCNVVQMPVPGEPGKTWGRVLLVAIPAAVGFVAGWAMSQFTGHTCDYDDDEEIEE